MSDYELAQALSKISISHTGDAPMELWKLFVEAIDEPEYPTAKRNALGRGMTVVPVSGGLDSTIAYYLAMATSPSLPLQTIYMDFGQAYASKEIHTLRGLEIPFIVERCDIGYRGDLGSNWKHIIPGRNLLILLRCAVEAGNGGVIYFGATKGEIPPTGGDKSEHFIDRAKAYLSESYGVKDIVTLAERTKSGWMRWWINAGNVPDYLLKTVSCFDPTSGHCGQCQACLRHYIAFANNGFPHSEIMKVYDRNPLERAGPYIEKYRNAMRLELLKPGSTTYGEERSIETLSVIDAEWLAANGYGSWTEKYGN
jgi:7-cyano-7-deazaguanine synthase in queuosine biosynthesis